MKNTVIADLGRKIFKNRRICQIRWIFKYETTEYLEVFLRNLLLNEQNEFQNRNLHISGLLNEEKVDIEKRKVDIEKRKVDIEKRKVDIQRTKVDIENVFSAKNNEFSLKNDGSYP